MGAYLSKPETAKETSSDSNEWVSYGCSSMQGWRRFQEDAHNCILEFDPKRTASFFAVYDGHGGSEVARYCSLHLPEFILSQPRYAIEDGPINPVSILKKAFIDFDVSLTRAKVKSELKEIASPDADTDTVELSPHNSDAEEDGTTEDGTKRRKRRAREAKSGAGDDDDVVPLPLTEEGVEEISELHEEAARPIEAVLRKQFRDELPDFIQAFLASISPKPGDAGTSGPSTSGTTSDELATGSRASTEEATASGNDKEVDEEAKVSPSATTSEEKSAPPIGEKEVEEEGKENDTKKAEEEDSLNLSGIVDESVGDKEEEVDAYDDDDEDDEDFEVDDEEDYDDDEEGEEVDYGEYDEDDDDDEEEEEEEGNSISVLPRPVGFTEPGVDSGSTACVALVLPEVGDQNGEEQQPRVCLYVANAGDSRAVLCRAGAAVDLSEDHKPEDPSEKARIQAAGGTVTADGRVNDGLNLSRAIGDHIYKCRTDLKMSEQMISALPDVSRTELIPGADEFVVIACDGIWNAMNSQAVVDFVYDRLHPESASAPPTSNGGDGEPAAATTTTIATEKAEDGKEETTAPIDRSSPAFLAKICEELFDACLASNTMGDGTGCDNMTCIILRFDNLPELAKRAITRTCTTPDAAEDGSDLEEVENAEVREAVESIEEGVEKEEEESSEELKSSFMQSSPTPVVNGNGGSGDGAHMAPSGTPPSPALSPAPKKARIEASPQNGDGGATVALLQKDFVTTFPVYMPYVPLLLSSASMSDFSPL
ncbi:Protein phosphatase 1G [Echinococcus granulosus]|uniref:protein-serine/threonine phosphatase n=1 Tax=Echinococcus granulosus TaxID=6210 RepID=A0A068WT77_ECHGR|nr:Protein phosphatase 1G [Echinococcus granulosus]CDS20793.1 protein phosphatase 2C [Echinococcus granulosus]